MARSNVYPQATAAAEEMPEECSQTPVGAAPGGTGPAEPDLPNRNTESNSKAKANTGAANGRRRRSTVDMPIKPPFRPRYHHGLHLLIGRMGASRCRQITSIKACHTCQHEKIMERILVLAKAGLFKTTSDAERMRNELIRSRRVAVCSLDLD